MKEIVDTLIVGAGMAGLGCAHTLKQNNKSFKIISKDLGGRVFASKTGAVNLGAIVVTDDYRHVLPYLIKERRVRMSEVAIHKGDKSYGYYSLSVLPHICSLIKLWRELRRFRKAYAAFRERSLRMSQKRAMEADSYLLGLYHQYASDFIREKGIESFCHKYLCEGVYAFTFTDIHKINTFAYLHFLQLIVVPFYIFKVNKKQLFEPLEKDTIIDEVIEVIKHDGYYEVKTESQTWLAKNLVMATPINISKKLLKFRKSKSAVSAHVLHVEGELKENHAKPSQTFFPPDELFGFIKQKDGSFVIYARHENADLSKYFSEYKILEIKYWKSAEFMVGTELLESKRKDNSYVIGDYNIAGLEDSFITGMYVANEIIGIKS